MSYKIVTLEAFDKNLKKLNKKFPSLSIELALLKDSLLLNPFQGKSLGKSVYKIGFAVKSKGQGKRGGLRLITWVVIIAEQIYLLSIYDKSQIDSISQKEIKEIISRIIKKIQTNEAYIIHPCILCTICCKPIAPYYHQMAR